MANNKKAVVKPAAPSKPETAEAQPGSVHPNCTKEICGSEDCHCLECAKERLK